MALRTRFLLWIPLALLIVVALNTPTRAGGDNELSFDNQSGLDAVVRVFTTEPKQSTAEVVVPNGKQAGTNLPNGQYYIVVKYGPKKDAAEEQKYSYSKGEPFDLNPPAGQRISAIITLHKVISGNYVTKEVDPEEFEK